MILGQSTATAAVLAMDGKRAVQDVPYEELRKRLLADGQVLVRNGTALLSRIVALVISALSVTSIAPQAAFLLSSM